MAMKYTDGLLKKIANNEFSNNYLDLSNQSMIDRAVPALVMAMKTNIHIKALNLSENLLIDEGIKRLVTLELLSLDLSGNIVKELGAAALSKSQIQELNLYNTCLENNYLAYFANNHTLKKLNISQNCVITAEGVKYLASTKIESLIAGSLQGGDKLAQAISGEEMSFVELNLMQNSIGDEGAKALSINKNLRKLSLYYNEVGFEGVKALSQHKGLVELDLSRNRLDDAAAKLLGNIPTLKKLDISFNEDIKDIRNVLSTLKTLNPSLNVIANGYETQIIQNHDRQPNKRVKRDELPTFFSAAASPTIPSSANKNDTVWTGVIPSTILKHSVRTN